MKIKPIGKRVLIKPVKKKRKKKKKRHSARTIPEWSPTSVLGTPNSA